MKLRFTPRATSDLAAIADYIGERNPAAARRVRDAILDSLRAAFRISVVDRKPKTYASSLQGNTPTSSTIQSITPQMRWCC
jgi:hypothetical protein